MSRSKADIFSLVLVDELKKHCYRGKSRIQAFIKYNRQVEGWFKGELLKIAADLQNKSVVTEFHPDFRIAPNRGKQNIDLYFKLGGKSVVWIELKHWYLGRYQSGGAWTAEQYLTQKTSGTPYNVISKLPKDWSEPTYMLIVTTPRPHKLDYWDRGISRLIKTYPGRSIRCLTRLEDYPEYFFLGLISI